MVIPNTPSNQSGVPLCKKCNGSKEIPVPLPVDVQDNGGQFRPKIPCPDCPPAPSYTPRLDETYRFRADKILNHPNFDLLSHLLHQLWSKAVGTPDYFKADWQTLETVLVRMDAERFSRQAHAKKPDPRQKISLEDAACFCPLSSPDPNLHLLPICAWRECDLQVCGVIYQDRYTGKYGYTIYQAYTMIAMTLAIDTKDESVRALHQEMDRIRVILEHRPGR